MDSKFHGPRYPSNRAFTLIELLSVIALVLVLMSLTVGGLNHVVKSARLEDAGRMVHDELNFARQTAVARNELVQVRFMSLLRSEATGTAYYWKVQSGTVAQKDNTFTPLKAPSRFPDGIVMSSNATASPLLHSSNQGSSTSPAYSYRYINIRPTGEVEPVGSPAINELKKWCVTIVPEHQSATAITPATVPNFMTIQIDPLTAHTKTYRP